MSMNKQNSRQYINKGLKGWKRYLPLVNIVLFIGVVTLGVIGVFLFRAVSSPFAGFERIKTKIPPQQVPVPTIQTNAALQEAYDLLANENPFAPSRKEWVLPQSKIRRDAQKQAEDKALLKVPPKQIVLYGIAIFEDLKKALVKNPDPAKHGVTPLVYVEEGSDIGGYKVKSIEPNLIRLVWEGEESVVNVFADKENVKTLPSSVAASYTPPTPPPPRPEAHKRTLRERGSPQGRYKRTRDEDWDDEDWDDEDWDDEDWDDEDWDDEDWDEEEEEYWDEDYERRGKGSKSRKHKKSFRRPRRR